MTPVRQAFVNGLIPSEQRATVSVVRLAHGLGGGWRSQPILGKAADMWGYPLSYVVLRSDTGRRHPVRVARST